MIEPNFICLLYRANCNLLFEIDNQKPTNRIIYGFMARIFSLFFYALFHFLFEI